MFTICVYMKNASHIILIYMQVRLFICEKMAGNSSRAHTKNGERLMHKKKFLSSFYEVLQILQTKRKIAFFMLRIFFMCCNHFSEVNWWPFLRAFMHCLMRKCTFLRGRRIFCWQCWSFAKTWAEFIGNGFFEAWLGECSLLQTFDVGFTRHFVSSRNLMKILEMTELKRCVYLFKGSNIQHVWVKMNIKNHWKYSVSFFSGTF